LPKSPAAQCGSDQDVTKQVVLLYGRSQSFDNATGVLSIDLLLGNRGDKPIRPPIRLEVTRVSSGVGRVTILNANNGLTGEGTIWDVSPSVTGDQIPPGANTYNTFRLSFRIELRPGGIPTYSLLNLNVRVLANTDALPP